MKRYLALSVASLSLAWAPACDKKTEPAAEQPAAETAKAEEPKADEPAGGEAKAEEPKAEEPKAEEPKAEEPKAEEPKAEEPKAEEPKDHIKATIDHHDTSKGLVTVEFGDFKVVKAHVDLENLEKAMAVVEFDIASLKSGIDKRDEHLKSPDFFDVAQFAKGTFTVSKLEKTEEADVYKASAEVDIHGMKKEIPVSFKVVEKKDDGTIVVEAEAKDLARADWGVGAEPEKAGAAATFAVSMRLTLKTTEEAPAADAPAAE
jgi:polyisoprenoid-binding protein YceI